MNILTISVKCSLWHSVAETYRAQDSSLVPEGKKVKLPLLSTTNAHDSAFELCVLNILQIISL